MAPENIIILVLCSVVSFLVGRVSKKQEVILYDAIEESRLQGVIEWQKNNEKTALYFLKEGSFDLSRAEHQLEENVLSISDEIIRPRRKKISR